MTLEPSEDLAANATTRRAERLMAEAMTVIDTARSHHAHLRLTGGLAVRRYATDLAFVDREFSDIDLIGLSGETARLRRTFEELGYEENHYVAQATGGAQLQYLTRTQPLEHARMLERPQPLEPANVASNADHVDVFLDAMRMDHDVDARGRLTLDPYAISPADVLLTKLQIGQIAAKDLHDIIALLKDVPLGDRDGNASINASRLARACARDWGLFHDVVANLELVASGLGDFSFRDEEKALVAMRLAALREAISSEDKSLRWRLRARAGTRLPWRREVEDRDGSLLIVRAPTVGKRTVLSCIDCTYTLRISTQLAYLPASPLACPRCGSVDLQLEPPETKEPAAA